MNFSELASKFNIIDHVQIILGKGDLTRVDLNLGASSVQVYLHGGTVTSFKDESGEELLYLR